MSSSQRSQRHDRLAASVRGALDMGVQDPPAAGAYPQDVREGVGRGCQVTRSGVCCLG